MIIHSSCILSSTRDLLVCSFVGSLMGWKVLPRNSLCSLVGFSKLNFNPKSRSPGPYMLRGPIYVTWFVLWAPSRLDWVLQSSAYKFWPTKRKISPRIWLNACHSPNPETHLLYGPTYVIGLLWFKDENVFPINKYILFIPP